MKSTTSDNGPVGSGQHDESVNRQVMRSGLSSLLIRVAYVPLQFALSVVLARWLGPEGLGIYSFTIALVMLLVIPGQLGFPNFLVRMGAIYALKEQYELLKGLFRFSFVVVAVVSSSLGILAGVAIRAINLLSGRATEWSILIGLSLIPLLALMAVVGGATRGLGHVIAGQLAEQLVRPSFVLLLVLVLGVSLAKLTPEIALVANVVATGFALLMGWWIYARRRPGKLRAAHADRRPGEWIRESFAFLLLAVTQVVNHQTDILMLGLMSDRVEVGIYRVATQIADGMGMLLIALAAVITPTLARLHAQEDWNGIQRALVQAHRAAVTLLLPITLILVLWAPVILRTIFGSQYERAGEPLAILAIGKVAYASVGFSGVALSMFGRARAATVVTGLTAIANLILNLLLIPEFRGEGAAIATAASSFALSFGCVLWMRRFYGIDASVLGARAVQRAQLP